MVLGFDVGAAETYEFWLEFLRSLVARGLRGVKLVISDAHEGLKRAISEVLSGASWQRCRVHFMRSLLARVPKHAQSMVAAIVRTVFAQPDQASARHQLEQVARNLERRFPQVATMLCDAADEVLTYMAFPDEHRRRIHSTNVLERLNRELARRCDVVGIFPNVRSVLRLLGAILEESRTSGWRYGDTSAPSPCPNFTRRQQTADTRLLIWPRWQQLLLANRL